MKKKAHILLIEDDPSISSSLAQVLSNEGYEVEVVTRGDDGLEVAQQNNFSVVLTDLVLPGLNGFDLIQKLHQAKPRLPIILMTAHGTTETAIETTKLGAYEYLVKPFEIDELLSHLDKAVSISHTMSVPVEMGNDTAGKDAIIGKSRIMQKIYKELGRIAATTIPVLIRGETGTGKELIARAIYQYSHRSQQPFIAVNCAAIPETLLESELFGHERGAFTSADSRRIGRFEQAHKGTIFLDEIGDMSLSTQSKLLRVLQEKCIQRLGGKETISIDVRIITATHRDLEAAIVEKQFREDLYYRINVAVIQVPLLKKRSEDIPALVDYFLRRYAKDFGILSPSIHPQAVQLLQERSWPGNVRELENMVRKALLQSRGYTISAEDIQLLINNDPAIATTNSGDYTLRQLTSELLDKARKGETENVYSTLMEILEKELFTQAIQVTEGNQAKAARWLGISRLTMREKLNYYGLRQENEN